MSNPADEPSHKQALGDNGRDLYMFYLLTSIERNPFDLWQVLIFSRHRLGLVFRLVNLLIKLFVVCKGKLNTSSLSSSSN